MFGYQSLSDNEGSSDGSSIERGRVRVPSTHIVREGHTTSFSLALNDRAEGTQERHALMDGDYGATLQALKKQPKGEEIQKQQAMII